MGSLIKSLYSNWQLLTEDLGDNRTRGWFMTNSPIPVVILIFLYYQFVKRIGPEFMKDRKPFNLDKIIQIYNILQVIACGWLTYESFRITYGPSGTYNWHCQPMDSSSSPLAVKVATLTWIYYMIKIIDLLDTVFFVLRKKFNQASFLHVYHHIGTLALGYVGTKYYPDGQGFILIPLNSFVHCFMYFYYFLTNYNQEYKRKIWWKKYITQLQLSNTNHLTTDDALALKKDKMFGAGPVFNSDGTNGKSAAVTDMRVPTHSGSALSSSKYFYFYLVFKFLPRGIFKA